MIIRTRNNAKGLKDIRTHSGKVDRVGIPYMAYMNISCLEMERARREAEKRSALSRVKNIDRRIREIDAEKDVLLKKLGERAQEAPKEAVDLAKSETQEKRGFKLRY
jgi:hypothetical protein